VSREWRTSHFLTTATRRPGHVIVGPQTRSSWHRERVDACASVERRAPTERVRRVSVGGRATMVGGAVEGSNSEVVSSYTKGGRAEEEGRGRRSRSM